MNPAPYELQGITLAKTQGSSAHWVAIYTAGRTPAGRPIRVIHETLPYKATVGGSECRDEALAYAQEHIPTFH